MFAPTANTRNLRYDWVPEGRACIKLRPGRRKKAIHDGDIGGGSRLSAAPSHGMCVTRYPAPNARPHAKRYFQSGL